MAAETGDPATRAATSTTPCSARSRTRRRATPPRRSTAAIEAAAGALSRAFASARVEGAPHVVKAVTGRFLGQVGRDLIRSGESMTWWTYPTPGRIELLTAASWHWEGNAHPRSQTVRVTFYGLPPPLPGISRTKALCS